MKVLFILLSSSIILILGCSNIDDPKILVGKYYFSTASNQDSLFVNEDRTYEHKFTATNGRIFKASGKWNYNSNSSEMNFEDFVFFSDEGADDFGSGTWYAKVRLTDDGEVRLMYSSEDNIYFSKK